MQGDRENVLNAGFDGYLSKPINGRDLANELERLLRKREDRDTALNQSPEGNTSAKKRAAGTGK